MRLKDAAEGLARKGVLESSALRFRHLEFQGVSCSWRCIGWYTFFTVSLLAETPVIIDASDGRLPPNWFALVAPFLQAL